MPGDGLADAEARTFWAKARRSLPRPFATVRELCEVALLGGALLVAHKFSQSSILLGLYGLLIVTFAIKITSYVALPKAYDSPLALVLLGAGIVVAITYVEHLAIKSAANATLVQLQSDKAAKLIAAQRVQRIERNSLDRQFFEAGCRDRERASAGTYHYDLCDSIARKRHLNEEATANLLEP